MIFYLHVIISNLFFFFFFFERKKKQKKKPEKKVPRTSKKRTKSSFNPITGKKLIDYNRKKVFQFREETNF